MAQYILLILYFKAPGRTTSQKTGLSEKNVATEETAKEHTEVHVANLLWNSGLTNLPNALWVISQS